MVALCPESLAQFRDMIPVFVQVISDTTGMVRKNASITLAKLCQEKGNLELAKSLHGTELLVNLQKYIMEAK